MGQQNNAQPQGCVAQFFSALVLIGLVAWFFNDHNKSTQTNSPPDSSPASPSATPASSIYVAKANCYAGTSIDNIKKFTQFAIDKDYDAMAKMEGSSDVVLIPEGEEVFNAYGGFTAGINGLVEIRRRGETDTLWTPNEFLSPKSQNMTPNQAVTPADSNRLDSAPMSWKQIDEWRPSAIEARFVVKTNAKNEVEFYRITEEYRIKAAGSYAFTIGFFPDTVPNPLPLAQYISGNSDDDSWDDNEIAQYDCNLSGKGYLDLYQETPKALPVSGIEATELYTSEVIDLHNAVVRVNSYEQSALAKVAEYYEAAYSHPKGLTIYFTTTTTKWRKYPRVYPASIPPEIGMVYSRNGSAPGEFVEGNKFQ